MRIGTIASGVGTVTTFQLAFLPERLRFIAATQLTAIKVNILGEGVICDLDANGITSIGKMQMMGDVTNGYQIPLADGLIPAKNVEITITNSAAVAVDLYAESTNKGGKAYVQCLRSTAFASTPVDLTKFSYLGLQNAAASDQIDITYQDGTINKTEFAELPFILALMQNSVATPKGIDNTLGLISKVRFIPNATQIIYIVNIKLTQAGVNYTLSME